MRTSHLFLGLTLAILPLCARSTWAQVAPDNTAPQMAPTVTPLITGLKEPQGMALDAQGNLLVCNYGAGEVLRFTRDGQPLGQLATDIRGPWGITSADGGKTMFVSERGGNRVLRFGEGRRQVEMEDVPQPMGVLWDFDAARGDGDGQMRRLWAVSHSTSKIYRKQYFKGYVERRLVYATITQPNDGRFATSIQDGGGRSGFRALAGSGDTFYVSDEAGQRVLKLTQDGQISTFAAGVSNPNGIAIGPDKMVYVANEGEGGQLLRFNAQGEKTVVAQKLGRPQGLLFLDAKTLLVSNSDGKVWKVNLP